MENNKVDPSFRKLYPHLSEEQLLAAQQRLDHYLEIVMRIHERLCSDSKVWAEFEVCVAEERKPPNLEDQNSEEAI